jgi:uncharacterized protein
MNRELRTFVAQELRASGSDKQPKIEGYAATFGTVANIGSFNEVIQRGAFSRSLADGDEVVALVDHNSSLLLGRRSAGTLNLQEDSKGLKFSCELPDTTTARDCYANLKAGNLKECSFGFYIDGPDGESWSQLPDGTMLRTLVSVRLFDVSVVCFPAYDKTSASARNIVAPDVESRAAALSVEAGTTARRARVQAVLAQIKEEERKQLEREALALDDQQKNRLSFLRAN